VFGVIFEKLCDGIPILCVQECVPTGLEGRIMEVYGDLSTWVGSRSRDVH
jgi:hypothetical protein